MPPPALHRAASHGRRLRRHIRAEHCRFGRQDHPPGAYLDDMRALRNDSVDVYAPGDSIDQVISQIERLQQAGATPSRCISTRKSSRSFIAWSVRRGPACRGRASARSRMPCRPGRTSSGTECGSMCTPGILPRRSSGTQAPDRRGRVHVAARVGLAHYGLMYQAGLRWVYAKTVPHAAQDRAREALAAADPQRDTTRISAHP